MARLDFGNIWNEIKSNPLIILVPTIIIIILLNLVSTLYPVKLGLAAQVLFLFLASVFAFEIYDMARAKTGFRELIIPAIIVIVFIILMAIFPTVVPSQFSVIP